MHCQPHSPVLMPGWLASAVRPEECGERIGKAMKKTRSRNTRPGVLAAAAALALVLVLGLSGCGGQGKGTPPAKDGQPPEGFPMTLIDDLGYEAAFDKAPEKIVSLSPANTEILFALGLGDKVAARTDYCNYPKEAEALPSIGDFNAPNVEKIISLMPDLAMATDFIQDDIRAQLEAAGIKVVVYNAQSIDEVKADVEKTGWITGAREAAARINEEIEERRRAVAKAVKAALHEPRSVFIDIGDFYSAGEGSLLDSQLSELGLKNIAADIGMQWPQLPIETIIAADPDVYVSFYTKPEELRKVDGLNAVKAIRDGRIVYYEMLSPKSDLVQRPGPRIALGLEQLARDIVPEAFQQ